jgi:hypothetical protein
MHRGNTMRPSSFFTIILLLIFSTSLTFAGHGSAGVWPAVIPTGHVVINCDRITRPSWAAAIVRTAFEHKFGNELKNAYLKRR